MSSSEAEEDLGLDPGPSKKAKHYAHKYQTCWERHDQYKLWIKPSKLGELYFYCSFCCNNYKCGKSEIIKHMKSKKHIKNAADSNHRQTITNMLNFIPLDQKIKSNETKIALFISEHNLPVNIVDHLILLLKSLHLEKEVIQKMKCNRTKCSKIITGVTGAHQKNIIVEDLKREKFSLIIDESTDRSSMKQLALIARYIKDDVVQDAFLSLIPVADGRADNLYATIKTFFNENNIPYTTNMIGFAADGASVMMGKHHSTATLLRNDIPNLFILKCVCHSFALCASYATKHIPDEVEVMVKQIYAYMNFSYKRQQELREFQEFTETKIHKILSYLQVRWLSLNAAVDRTLEQYDALKLYFRSQYLDNINDKCAQNINALMENSSYKVYLQFLAFVLPIFTKINKEFQSEAPKIHKLYEQVLQTYKTILDFYVKPEYLKQNVTDIQVDNPRCFLNLDEVYYGPRVTESLLSDTLSAADKHSIKVNCLQFYIAAAQQIKNRFPFNEMEKLKILEYLDPNYIRTNRPPSIVPLYKNFPHLLNNTNLDELDRQFRLLRNDSYLDTFTDGSELEFWVGLKRKKNADGTMMYGILIQYMLNIFVLPHSSATVERLFSVINLNKTKSRNRLSNEMLAGILYTKDLLTIKNNCCYNFPITNDILAKHNLAMYS